MSSRVASLALLMPMLLLAACGGGATSAPPPSAAPRSSVSTTASGAASPVHEGDVGGLAGAGVYLARDRGYFAQEGVNLDLAPFQSAAKMVPALAADQLDVGAGAISAGLFNATQRNVGIKIVAPLARHDPNASSVFLVVRKALIDGGKVKAYADLKGLKIAIAAKASSNEYAAAKALQAGGLTLQDAELIELDFTSMLTGLANGGVDVAVMTEPFTTTAVQKGLGVRWKSIADVLPGVQFTVVLFSPGFAAKKELATRWMTAYLRGVREYNDAFFKNVRRQETVDVLKRTLKLQDPKLYDEMGYTAMDPDGKVNLASLQDQMDWYVSQGEMKAPVDLAQVVDASFAAAAVAKLGTYR